MTQNLKIVGPKTLVAASSDIVNDYLLPASSPVGEAYNPPQDISRMHSEENSCGGWYNWYTATAGEGTYNKVSSDIVDYSICPKQWSLPSRTQIQSTISNYGNSEATITSLPFEATLCGDYEYTGKLEGPSVRGTGLLSKTAANKYTAYILGVEKNSVFEDAWYKYNGYNVRCVAR